MRFLSLSLAVAGWLVFSPGHAETIPVPDSTSPDGKYRLLLQTGTREDVEQGTGKLLIEALPGKDIVATFNWEQFGHTSTEGAVVLWRPDSRAFALSLETTKGFTDSFIYVRDRAGWKSVEVPEFRPKQKPADEWKDRGKGEYTAKEWLKGDQLKMLFDDDIYRFDKGGGAGRWSICPIIGSISCWFTRPGVLSLKSCARKLGSVRARPNDSAIRRQQNSNRPLARRFPRRMV